MTNKQPSDPLVEEHLAWAVTEGGNWSGGNAPLGTYTAAYRDYKLKLYDASGFAGEQRIYVSWAPSQTYKVRAEIKGDRAVYIVKLNGSVVSEATVFGAAPARVTMGYGWPPSVRQGATGAILTNIRWEESAVTLPPPTPVPAACPAGSKCFAPVADTWADPNQPGTAHGSDSALAVGGDGRTAYLRFDLTGLGSIATAHLDLKASNAGGTTEVHAVASNSWTEAGLTFNNRPALAPLALDSEGRVEIGNVATFKVIDAIPSGGVYSFAIRSADLDGSAYHSKESAEVKPVLIVTEGVHPLPPSPPPTPDAGVHLAPDAGAPVVPVAPDAGVLLAPDAGAPAVPVAPDAGMPGGVEPPGQPTGSVSASTGCSSAGEGTPTAPWALLAGLVATRLWSRKTTRVAKGHL